jgi:hypothetical protein
MIFSEKNALLLGLKEDNISLSDNLLTLSETSEMKLYLMNFVIKIESVFGIEPAN